MLRSHIHALSKELVCAKCLDRETERTRFRDALRRIRDEDHAGGDIDPAHKQLHDDGSFPCYGCIAESVLDENVSSTTREEA